MVRSIEDLADRQMRRWALVRRAGADRAPRPCIALSRQPGTEATEFAQQVAEALGYACFDIEIVEWIARRAGVARDLVAGVDGRVRNAIERSVADTFRRESERFTESDYLHHLVRVVAALGEQGSAVIVGRGAPYILGPERALRVLVVAPREQRAERFGKLHALDLEHARSSLAREEASRREFLRQHFGRESDEPSDFDLTLNLGSLAFDAALRLLLEAFSIRFPNAPKARAAP